MHLGGREHHFDGNPKYMLEDPAPIEGAIKFKRNGKNGGLFNEVIQCFTRPVGWFDDFVGGGIFRLGR
jgi:hypothetical protein